VVLSSLESFSVLSNVLLISFALLVGVMVLLLLFYFVRPLNRLYERVVYNAGVEPERGNVFVQIEQHLDTLSSDCQELTEKLEHWNALLHKTLLVRLLRGEYQQSKQLRR